jgi:hypothetical protein
MSAALKTFAFAFLGVVWVGVAYAQSGPYQYYPLTPCRVVDTRNANGVNGGPAFDAGGQRDFAVRGNCGVPVTARAITMNIVIVTPAYGGYLTAWASGVARPVASTLNFAATDSALANGAIIGVSTNAQDLSVYNGSNGTAHAVIDVTGYFQ